MGPGESGRSRERWRRVVAPRFVVPYSLSTSELHAASVLVKALKSEQATEPRLSTKLSVVVVEQERLRRLSVARASLATSPSGVPVDVARRPARGGRA